MDNLLAGLERFERVAVPLEGRRHAAVALASAAAETIWQCG